MKQVLIIFLISFLCFNLTAQNRTDSRTAGASTVIRLDNSNRQNEDGQGNTPDQTTVDNVSFYSTGEGIVLSINNSANKIKLYALTGQLIFNGELSQGRFLIPTRKGIYFLKINNKSYKVICK